MVPATTLELVPGLDVRLLDGLGVLDQQPDPAEYDKMHVHADVAVVGAGPAGLAAAREAASGGARVVLFEQDFRLGGSLLAAPRRPSRAFPPVSGSSTSVPSCDAAPEVTILTRTTVVGSYDNNHLIAAREAGRAPRRRGARRHISAAHLARDRRPGRPRDRCVRAPVVFADNDVPGVMLASAVRTYVRRYATVPGRAAVVFTTNDSGYATAHALRATGA